jgi:ribosomal protein S18 acetylase RimI-like enzyme
MPALEITPYDTMDESEVVGLVRELQAHEAKLFDRMMPPNEMGSWYILRLLQKVGETGGTFLVARLEGRIVGYATLLARQTTETVLDEVVYSYASIGDLVVAESARGLGIGARLIEECENLARADGQKWLRITVLAANARARQLYERMGFTDCFIDMEKPLA